MKVVVDLDFSRTVISETQLFPLELVWSWNSGVRADGRETQGNGRSVVEREKGRAGCLTKLLGPGNPCPGLVSQLRLFPSRTDPVSIS